MNILRRLTQFMTRQSGWKLAVIFGFSALLVLALGVAAFTGVRTASANTTGSGCPSGNAIHNFLSSNDGLAATFSIDVTGKIATYTFKSNTGETDASSTGVPGLIEYCVYPNYPNATTKPDSTTVVAVGANGGAWTEPSSFDRFSYQRPDGDPSNIPFDGTTVTMGTATWNAGAYTSQTILLHINDLDECQALYPGSTDPTTGLSSTCFVYPGGTAPPAAQDLTVSKTAAASFTRTYGWTITKSVDNTQINIAKGGSATFNYMISVSHDSGTDGGWMVGGTITVSNPNGFDVSGVNVTDAIDNGGSCSVTGGTNVTVPAKSGSVNGSVTLNYTCTFSSNPSSGTNTATASWTDFGSQHTSATGTATYDFSSISPTVTDKCVTVTDTLGGSLGTVCVGGANPTTFTYSYTFTGDPGGTCTSHGNTATFTTDTGKTGSASQTVKVCVGEDLTVSKTATPSFTRTYNWDIKKSVDKTLLDAGGTATYTVSVTETGFTDSGWKVAGTITVTNPNDWEAITTDVSDVVDNGGNCTVSGGSGISVPASSSQTLNYTCTYASAPSPSSGTNTATATWDSGAFFTPDGSASGTAGFAFTTPTTTVNKTITVTDSYAGTLGTATATDPPAAPTSQTFTYTRKFTPPASGCVTVNNTATIVETGQTDTASVKNCNTGALTMGFWQNMNGQGIIKAGASTAGVCNSGTWLRQYAPFQDLSATASCSQVATYVYNVIKAANASGASMNAILKAQMLATSLDVYFSDPALGGNKIGAPAPIGGVSIDLTKICTNIPTCTSFTNVSSAFGGANSLTVSQMLAYAASQSNAGGSSWYGQVKATQELAKDAFDAINNQVAFSP